MALNLTQGTPFVTIFRFTLPVIAGNLFSFSIPLLIPSSSDKHWARMHWQRSGPQVLSLASSSALFKATPAASEFAWGKWWDGAIPRASGTAWRLRCFYVWFLPYLPPWPVLCCCHRFWSFLIRRLKSTTWPMNISLSFSPVQWHRCFTI